MRTSAAALWQSDALLPETETMLDTLDYMLADDELSFAPDLRYRTATPPDLAALLRHEGHAPLWPAVVTPHDPDHLRALARKITQAGFTLTDTPALHPATTAIPVNFQYMSGAELISKDDGLVRLHRGTDWHQFATLTEANGLAVPGNLHDIFPMPFEAATAGLFGAPMLEDVHDIPHSAIITLPPAETHWLDATWLFQDSAKAFEVMQQMVRRGDVVLATLTNDVQLQMGACIGAWHLPQRFINKKPFTALRCVFQGTRARVQTNRFLASWTIEKAGGQHWLDGPVWPASKLYEPLLRCGALSVTTQHKASWSDVASTRYHVSKSQSMAAMDGTQETMCTPLITEQLCATGTSLTLSSGIVAPRQFASPLAQYRAIATAAAPAHTATAPIPLPETTDMEDSDAWQAIRHALMDEHGQVRPTPLLEAEEETPALKRQNG